MLNIQMLLFLLLFFNVFSNDTVKDDELPLVLNTWFFYSAAETAWNALENKKSSAIDALEAGCTQCEIEQCDGTVGYGGSPDENGETTLDALIFDGTTMNMGAVGALRRVKSAISVAKAVLQNTEHSFLVGDQATNFAAQMGFQEQSLSTPKSTDMWLEWKKKSCQPNFWINVKPDPKQHCGPYNSLLQNDITYQFPNKERIRSDIGPNNHDTIGMIIIDKNGNVVAGTSTNGARNKIPGRVGDSPIPGAGAYADSTIGGAAATGDGDVMMRFLPSFLAVEQLRQGKSPTEAGRFAMDRIAQHFPRFFGGIIVANKKGEYGAACNGMEDFPYIIRNKKTGAAILERVKCTNNK